MRSPPLPFRVVVVGAGIGGLAAALTLSCRGVDVTVVERAAEVGGKLRSVEIDGQRIDCGPTVFTLRSIFEDLFAQAGERLDEHLSLTPLDVLARHAWPGDSAGLDLYADIDRSAAAIGDFAGADAARGYRRFCGTARALFERLEGPFIHADRPEMLRLLRPAAGAGFAVAAAPFTSLWRALGSHFADQRLRQLFARYATYCGSSPFACPATLMLVAHVEQSGVWTVRGGMHRLAAALAKLAAARGVKILLGRHVATVRVERGRVGGVDLADGDRIDADAVVCNADCAALATGLFGDPARAAVTPQGRAGRSNSAVTLALLARPHGFALARHNVFFSPNYRQEFDDIAGGRVPDNPTVYVCAQDRDDAAHPTGGESPERLFCIVNAPPNGDTHAFTPSEIAQCEARTFRTLERCGLTLESAPRSPVTTTPGDFHRRFPATGGALYGAASHGWMASFRRSGVRSRLPGLYLCGGSVHPGPGLPMAALSGQMAALAATRDWASRRRSRPVGTRGGMSTA